MASVSTNQAEVAPDTGLADDAPSIEEEQRHRPGEELMMLYLGFGTGLLIAVVFLVYVVLAIASGETTSFAPHH
jgi:Tfp pilus assembly protein PilN